MKTKNRIRIETIYSLIVLLSTYFHLFNKIEVGGTKLFYYPVGIAFLLSFIIKGSIKDWSAVTMAVLTLFFSFFCNSNYAVDTAFTFFVIIFSTRKFTLVGNKVIYSLAPLLTLIACILHVPLWLTLPSIVRFEGYYNDPNYFIFTLLFFLFLSFLSILYWIKQKRELLSPLFITINIIDALFILFFTFVSASRTGLLCIALMMLGFLIIWFRKKPIFATIAITVLTLIAIPFIRTQSTNTFESMTLRLTGGTSDDIKSAGSLRLEISQRGLIFLHRHPEYILMGAGIGESGQNKEFKSTNPNSFFYRDHNTITSCLTEQGLINLLLFIFLWGQTIALTLKFPQDIKLLSIFALLAIFIFSLSIWVMIYVPFWCALFLIRNFKPSAGIK